jgi:hypothetical protein
MVAMLKMKIDDIGDADSDDVDDADHVIGVDDDADIQADTDDNLGHAMLDHRQIE